MFNRIKRNLARRWLKYISLEELESYVKDEKLRRGFASWYGKLVESVLTTFSREMKK